MDGRKQTFFVTMLVALTSTIGVLVFLGNVLAPYRGQIAILMLATFFTMIALAIRGIWLAQNKASLTYDYKEEALIGGDIAPGFKERTQPPFNDTLCG